MLYTFVLYETCHAIYSILHDNFGNHGMYASLLGRHVNCQNMTMARTSYIMFSSVKFKVKLFI